MPKSRKVQLLSALETAVTSAFHDFHRYEGKSKYIWPGERVLVSHSLISPATAFIVLVPNPKGYDEFTVELLWSPGQAFPELTQRPSGVPNQNEVLLSREQASVRLFCLGDSQADNWVPVSAASIEELVSMVLHALTSFGLPYLRRARRPHGGGNGAQPTVQADGPAFGGPAA